MNPYPVLDRLYEERIFGADRNADGTVTFVEACDNHFKLTLTPAEVLALADELKAFVAAQTQTTAMAELPSGDPT